jgi:ubiquitin-protein ligase
MIHFSGKFCHDLLKKTAQWTMRTSLVDVVKAIVHTIDHPNIDYSLSLG